MKALLALFLVPILTVSARAGAPDRPKLAVPFSETEPALTAGSADPVWGRAASIDGFALPLGVVNAETPAATKVSLLWTKANLWLRFSCAATGIARLPGVSAAAPERDRPYHKADCVEMFVDPVGDGRCFVELQVSPDNGVFDGLHLYSSEVESDPNFLIKEDLIRRESWFFPEWNLPGLQTAATIHLDTAPKGWDAVIALPAKSLLRRLGKNEYTAGMTLRANLVRFDYSTPSAHSPVITNWAPVPPGRAHRTPAGMGYLILTNTAPAVSPN